MGAAVLSTAEAARPVPAALVAADTAEAFGAAKNAPARRLQGATRPPRVPEGAFVRAIDAWLQGDAWPYARAAFAPFYGINVRLEEVGDDLICEGVAIVGRYPSRLRDLPTGARTSNRLEARGLAAVAVRGDAWRYGLPKTEAV